MYTAGHPTLLRAPLISTVKIFSFWSEPQNHSDDCYFCFVNVTGYNLKNINYSMYLLVRFAIHVSHGLGMPAPSVAANLVDVCDDQEIMSKSCNNNSDRMMFLIPLVMNGSFSHMPN